MCSQNALQIHFLEDGILIIQFFAWLSGHVFQQSLSFDPAMCFHHANKHVGAVGTFLTAIPEHAVSFAHTRAHS
jgi:hypothetical protein